MSVGKKIKMYLIQNNISQVWLSGETKISTSKLNASLNEKRKLPSEELEKIVKALNVDANLFVQK